MFQELTGEDIYFWDNDEQIYTYLRDTKGYTNEFKNVRRDDNYLVLKIDLENMLQKKMHLRDWRYLHGEHLYRLTNRCLTMNYKTYTIVKEKNLPS